MPDASDREERSLKRGTFRGAEPRGTGDTDDSIREVIGFVRSNWKLLGGLTLIFSLLALVLGPLVIPAGYSKQLSLSVVQAPSELLSRLELTPLDPDRAGRRAEEYLQEGEFGPVQVRPRYDNASEQIAVALRSENETAIQDATGEVVEVLEQGFRAEYEETLGVAISSRLATLEAEAENNRELVERIDAQLRGGTDPEALRTQRAVASLEVEQAELERQDLEEAQRDLPRLAEEPVSIEVVSESRVRSTSSPFTRATFALLVGLFAAVVLTILLNAFRKR